MRQLQPWTNKASTIVKMIEEGCDYTQVMVADPNISKKDLFDAVMLALRMKMNEALSLAHAHRFAAIKTKYPRAYEIWTSGEDEQLRLMYDSGMPVEEVAELLQRRASAIHSENQGIRQIVINSDEGIYSVMGPLSE